MFKTTRLLGETFSFYSLKEIMAKANEERSGDQLAGVSAESMKERMAAKQVLAGITLADIRNYPLLSPDEDNVSALIESQIDSSVYDIIKNWTVGELREYILSDEHTREDLLALSKGLSSEMIAAATKNYVQFRFNSRSSKNRSANHLSNDYRPKRRIGFKSPA